MKNLRLSAAAAVVAALVLIGASPANAATANGGVYGIVSSRDGWCSTTKPAIAWFNNTTGQSGTDYSRADDIFWLPVRLGTSNEITLTVNCGSTSRGWYGFIKPSRNGQSVFFKYPNGATITG